MLSVVTSSDENQVKFFIDGILYVAGAVFYDLTDWSYPKTPDAYKSVAELIMTAGYRFETHKIVTQDDYINTAWRIVGKLDESNGTPPEKKP